MRAKECSLGGLEEGEAVMSNIFIHSGIHGKQSREKGEKKKIILKVLNSSPWKKDGAIAGNSQAVKRPVLMGR